MAGPSLSPSAQLLPSPTLSASTSSYDIVSNCSRSSTAFQLVSEDSEDEIVWSISDLSITSDDDYVVPRLPVQVASGLPSPVVGGEDSQPSTSVTAPGRSLETQMTALNSTAIRSQRTKTMKVKYVPSHSPVSPAVSGKQKRGKKKPVQARPPSQAYPSPAPSPQTAKGQKPVAATSASPSPKVPPEALNEDTPRFGSRSIVDDYSDKQSIISYDDEFVGLPTLYEEASTYISSFLSNPDAKTDAVCRLALLQSLIIELGLATPSLPDSLTAAKAFLKSRAFLNIREYVAVRGQGPEAVQRALYPSKSALIKDIKKKRNPASLKWVKQHGLQVLLVGLMH